jgi:hypothetical protein
MTHDPSPPFQVAVCWDGVVATVTVTGEVEPPQYLPWPAAC